ncbi:MAG: hypothetical protein AAF416_12515 [Pseudomonadota bacterium]
MPFIVLTFVLPLMLVAAPSTGHASAEDYAACAASATDKRALRRCNTFKVEVEICNQERDSGGIDAPAICLGPKLEAWRAVMQAEEARAGAAGLQSETDFADWQAETVSWCRDAEQIRLSAERYGAPHAEFEALQCELRAVIRRTVQHTRDLRGF